MYLYLQELNKYRAKCSLLFHYDWISIPLVYTQVGPGAQRENYDQQNVLLLRLMAIYLLYL